MNQFRNDFLGYTLARTNYNAICYIYIHTYMHISGSKSTYKYTTYLSFCNNNTIQLSVKMYNNIPLEWKISLQRSQ